MLLALFQGATDKKPSSCQVFFIGDTPYMLYHAIFVCVLLVRLRTALLTLVRNLEIKEMEVVEVESEGRFSQLGRAEQFEHVKGSISNPW